MFEFQSNVMFFFLLYSRHDLNKKEAEMLGAQANEQEKERLK